MANGGVANSPLPYSPFATHYSLLMKNNKEGQQCAFSWSVPVPSADILAAGYFKPVAT
jgi:hypothetical protein